MGKNYLKVESRSLTHACYAIFCDLDDTTALWDNLEFFEAAAWSWIEKKCYQLEDNKPFGIAFIHILKWKCDKAEAAFDNYVKRQEWMTPGFSQLCDEIWKELSEEGF